MGLNARHADFKSDLADRVTREREENENRFLTEVREGRMPLRDYIVRVKGFQPEHADRLAAQFEKSIFG